MDILLKKDKRAYEKSVIIISTDTVEKLKCINNPLVFCCVNRTEDFSNIYMKVKKLIQVKENRKQIGKIKQRILREITYLGYNISYKGTNYLVECIELIMSNKERDFSNLKENVYPIIAKRNNTTIHNIKCNINKATEQMYCECDREVLKKYFGFNDDIKPTVKTVIYTIFNKI